MNKNIQNTEIAEFVKSTRINLGLGRTEFANLLGMNAAGERTIRGWETGEHKPSKRKLEDIASLEERLRRLRDHAPFCATATDYSFTFVDLFAGIGGIRIPFQEEGGRCIFTSEWDKFAQKTYIANFGEVPKGDITKITSEDIPQHDVLLGGFPCQAFSQAGLKKGFNDTRGTMFFEIQRILSEKRPKAFLLENVKQLVGHDKGRTLKTILSILRGEHSQEIPIDVPMSEVARKALSKKLNYWVDFKVIRAKDFGVPQNRERVFIIGFDKDYFSSQTNFENIFNWPAPQRKETRVGDILEDITTMEEDSYTISDKLWEGHKKRKEAHKKKGNGFGFSLFNSESEYTNTLSARYYKDGSEILIDQTHLGKNPRKLTPRECARLQGFPENFVVDAVSPTQIYKQFGNSVCVSVVRALAYELVRTLNLAERERQY